MSKVCEVKVNISNAEQKYTQSFLCYDPITISPEDPTLSKMVEDAVKNFKGQPDDVKVRIVYVW